MDEFGSIRNNGTQITGTVHDEIILEVPKGPAEKAAVILTQGRIQTGKAYLSKVPVHVDITIGETWAEK